MAGSINKVILIGNLGRDPEFKTMQDGKELALLALATSESWKDKSTGEKKEKTEWHRIVVFNEGLVGVIKNYLRKGAKLYIEGSLQTRKWTDNTGAERYTTEVILQGFNATLAMLDSRAVGNNNVEDFGGNNYDTGPVTNNNGNNVNFTNDELDDDIPF